MTDTETTTVMPGAAPLRTRSARTAMWWRANRVPVVLVLLVVVVAGPVIASDTAQPASRLSLTAALVEHHSVDLGPYRQALDIDFATYRGHLRSDKAPGQPILGIPFYAVARLAGAESASHVRVESNLTLWWMTFWSATLPLGLLLALLYVLCLQFAGRSAALAVTLLFGFATMLLPFGANLFGHDLAALLGFGAWFLLQRTPVSARGAALAGLAAGTAVLVEYETVFVAAVLLGFLLVRERHRVFAYVSGGVLPMLVLAWYQWRAFGAPWRTPAAFYNLRSGYTIPSPYDLWWMFGGGRGLWVGAPIAIVGIAAAIWLAYRGPGGLRDHAIVALAIIVPYIVLCAGWSGTRLLVDPGPRYLIPALPFLAVPLAALWDRVRVVALPVSALGVVVAAGATWSLLVVNSKYSVLVVYRSYFRERNFHPSLWSMGFGRFGIVLYAASVAAVVALLVHVFRHRTDVRSGDLEPLR